MMDAANPHLVQTLQPVKDGLCRLYPTGVSRLLDRWGELNSGGFRSDQGLAALVSPWVGREKKRREKGCPFSRP